MRIADAIAMLNRAQLVDRTLTLYGRAVDIVGGKPAKTIQEAAGLVASLRLPRPAATALGVAVVAAAQPRSNVDALRSVVAAAESAIGDLHATPPSRTEEAREARGLDKLLIRTTADIAARARALAVGKRTLGDVLAAGVEALERE